MKNHLRLSFVSGIILSLLVSCGGNVGVKNSVPENKELAEEGAGVTITPELIQKILQSQDMQEIKPIDIKSPEFFGMLQRWQNENLATVDGWGRFSEISFDKNGKMIIRPLVNFPRYKIDHNLRTWPEAGLIWISSSEKMYHFAWVDGKKTKSFVPLLSWRHGFQRPKLLDAEEGLVLLAFTFDEEPWDSHLIVYNYKTDTTVYDEDEILLQVECALNKEWLLCSILLEQNQREYFLYKWKSKEKRTNKFTETLTSLALLNEAFFSPHRNMNLTKRILIVRSNSLKQYVKITWSEDYEDVTVLPLNYLAPSGMELEEFTLSPNGEWGVTSVYGYSGLADKRLYKPAFVHFNSRYPDGVSPLVLTAEYRSTMVFNHSPFFKHPEYGLCCAMERYKGEDLYLRLYKMSDALAEINQQIEGIDKHITMK